MVSPVDKSNSFLDSVLNRVENVKKTASRQTYGGNPYLNSGELALATAGQAAGFIGDVVGQGLSTVGDAITPDFLGVGKAGEAATQAIMSSAPAQAVGEVILDFSEENPRTADAVGNLFNVSTLGAGGGILKAGATANKGAWSAGVKNYIDNFYGNDKKDVDPTKLEQSLGRIALKYKNASTTDKNVTMAGKKITGIMKWGAGGAASAIDSLLNPYSRGLYKETGISRKGQKAVNDLILKNKGNPSDRDLDKAVAQVTFNRHIIEQSDRKGEIGDPLFEIEDLANVQGYRPDTKANFRAGAKSTKFMTPDGKKVSTPLSVIDTAYDKINKAWGNKEDSQRKIVFKEPSGGRSGDHLKDLAFKHPANKHIRSVIANHKGKLTTEQLWRKLKDISDKTGDFSITQSLNEVKKEGIWVQSGMKGTAVVEGGVNGLMKILPNGRAIGFMSDKHDFLEKLPLVGKFLEKTLPRELMAVSGPMHMDIMGTRWAEQALEKAGKPVVARSRNSPVKRQDRPDAQQVLDDYVAARPSALGVARGFDPYTGSGLMAANTGGQQEE
tara:strand:- start:110 stop:1774 length:1665 start_codon:yes stop_codon:yes gene_type:complete